MQRRNLYLVALGLGLLALAIVFAYRATPQPEPERPPGILAVRPEQTPQYSAAIVAGFGYKTPAPLSTTHPLYASGRNAPVGAECNGYLGRNYDDSLPGAPVWESTPAPAGCAPGDCTNLGVTWDYLDDCISAAEGVSVTLASGTQVLQPISIQVPPYFLDAGDGAGTAANPWGREYVPEWMEPFALFTFTYDNGDGNTANDTYWGVRYDSAEYKNWLIAMIEQAGARYNDNPQVALVRVGIGYQAESQPVKLEALGSKNTQLRQAHEAAGVTCLEYRDFMYDLIEAAYTAFPDKAVFFNGAVGACGWNPYANGETLRERAYEETSDGNPGWAYNFDLVGLSLHGLKPDSADGEAWSTYTPRSQGYGVLKAGQKLDESSLSFPVAYEYMNNPSSGNPGTADDPWQSNYWHALAAAGLGADYVLPLSTWASYYTDEYWQVIAEMLGDQGDRAWVVLRDAEWPEFSWNAGTYGRSGVRGDWDNHAVILTPTAYPQACSASVRATATAYYKIQSDAGNTMGYNPCSVTLPTPVATYQTTPSVDAAGVTNMQQRLWQRQARQLNSSVRLGLEVAPTWQYYGDQADVSVSVVYLDNSATDFTVNTKTAAGTDAHVVDRVNSGLWKRTTWTVTDALITNSLAVSGIGNAFIEVVNGTAALYLGQLYFDVDSVGVEASPTPTYTPTPTATATATPTATTTATPTPTPTSTPSYTAGVRFNEVSPSELYDWSLSGAVSPADRYFELINWAATPADISGYKVDNGMAIYTFPTGTTIGPYAHKVFLAEDTVPIPAGPAILEFRTAGGATLADVTYSTAPGAGYCYAASPDGSGSFTWVAPELCSPGQPNP